MASSIMSVIYGGISQCIPGIPAAVAAIMGGLEPGRVHVNYKTRLCTEKEGPRQCWQPTGHKGLHSFEYCLSDTGEPGACSHSCDKRRQHDGPHHAEIEW